MLYFACVGGYPPLTPLPHPLQSKKKEVNVVLNTRYLVVTYMEIDFEGGGRGSLLQKPYRKFTHYDILLSLTNRIKVTSTNEFMCII